MDGQIIRLSLSKNIYKLCAVIQCIMKVLEEMEHMVPTIMELAV